MSRVTLMCSGVRLHRRCLLPLLSQRPPEQDGNVYEALFAYAKASPLNDPAFVRRVRDTQLWNQLDREFLKKGAATQRAGPVRSKL